jgi:carboxyl-terminal processing protease
MGNGGCAPVGASLVPNVTTVYYAYAAAEAGLHARGMTLDELRSIERSLSGSSVEGSLREGGVGYLRIRRFSSNVPSSVFCAVRALTGQGMTSLLIDLRGNSGGLVDPCVSLAGDFLEPGALVVTMTDSDGDEIESRARRGCDYDFPVALLVDARTASAAEVFAGCLQAHGRAVVVGERTYGKCGVQRVVTLEDGTPVYATVAKLTVPGGRLVPGRGVEPDLPRPSRDVAAWGAGAASLPSALRGAIVLEYSSHGTAESHH